jgi:hypothetical protein
MTEEATLYKTSDLHSLVPNAEETSTVGRPTDRRFHIDERWDAAIDLTLRRVTLGAVLGAVSAIVLFRSPTARASMLSLGIGFGAGTAFEQSQALVSNSYDEYIYIYTYLERKANIPCMVSPLNVCCFSFLLTKPLLVFPPLIKVQLDEALSQNKTK